MLHRHDNRFLSSFPSVPGDAELIGSQCRFSRPFLPVLRLELAFRFDDVAWLPPLHASLWRSVMGPALKQRDRDRSWCPSHACLLPVSLYDWLFATDRTPGLLDHTIPASPVPMVIDAPGPGRWTFMEPGQLMRFQITLVGRLAFVHETIIAAFRDAAARGIGRAITREGQRGRATLLSVHQVWHGEEPLLLWDGEAGWINREIASPTFQPPPVAGPVRTHIATPMRLHTSGSKRPVDAASFRPGYLFTSLHQRVAALMARECGLVLTADCKRLSDAWHRLRPLAQNLADTHQPNRYSASQRREIPADGITGTVDFDLSHSPELFDYLWTGQWISAGKRTSMGHGSLRLVAW